MSTTTIIYLVLALTTSAAEGLATLPAERHLTLSRARTPPTRRVPTPSLVAVSTVVLQQGALQSRHVKSPLLVAAVEAAPASSRGGVATAWGVFGFLSILASAVRRLLPHALQPLTRKDLSLLQVAMYGGSVLTFAYVEGYGAFQKKFSPMVVRRALTLGAGTPLHHKMLAPFYSMGLFHATKKRKIVSWSVSISVAMLVGIVKRLPYPWRSIVDAGVCVGLFWGGASILAFYGKVLASGEHPQVSAELP